MQNFPARFMQYASFVKGNLDRYFVCSLAICFFSFKLSQTAINYSYFKKNSIKKKNAIKSSKNSFQAA